MWCFVYFCVFDIFPLPFLSCLKLEVGVGGSRALLQGGHLESFFARLSCSTPSPWNKACCVFAACEVPTAPM